jgi:hypothetical protein
MDENNREATKFFVLKWREVANNLKIRGFLLQHNKINYMAEVRKFSFSFRLDGND